MNMKLLAFLVTIAALAGAGYWLKQQPSVSYNRIVAPTRVTTIQTTDDLKAAAKTLDDTDIDSTVDSGLSENESDAKSF